MSQNLSYDKKKCTLALQEWSLCNPFSSNTNANPTFKPKRGVDVYQRVQEHFGKIQKCLAFGVLFFALSGCFAFGQKQWDDSGEVRPAQANSTSSYCNCSPIVDKEEAITGHLLIGCDYIIFPKAAIEYCAQFGMHPIVSCEPANSSIVVGDSDWESVASMFNCEH